LRVRAFDGRDHDTGTTLLLGHTDTVHPRGALSTQSLHAEGDRFYVE
jgi:hypothetical protein